MALENVDLTLHGGIVGLFGQNGAGKSTLLRLVAGFLTPTAGALEILGGRWNRRDAEALRGAIGYLGHEAGLYPDLTLRENLDLFATLHGVGGARVAAITRALAIDDAASARGSELSAGLRRRAGVARALLHDPKVLLLDEPYANVDDEAAELISEAVREWGGPGRIAVIATHGAKRVKAFADASVILKRGRVVSHRVRTDAVTA